MAITNIEGFEHGLVQASLFAAITGAPTIETNGRYGGRNGRIQKTNANAINYQLGGSGTLGVMRVYIYFNSIPTVDCRSIVKIATAGSNDACIGFAQGTGKLMINDNSLANQTASTVTVVAGQWYCIDMRANFVANPWVVDWQIDGVAQTQWTPALAATTVHDFRCGSAGSTDADAYDVRYDDWACSLTTGDYPIGPGNIVALVPVSDGTHVPAPPDCIQDSTSTLISGSNAAWQYLDDIPMPSPTPASDFIKQITATATHYVEVNFGDLPIQAGSVNAVRAFAEVHGATSASCALILRSVGTTAGTTDVFNGTIASSTSLYKHSLVTAPGGGWTIAAVNELVGRVGFSSDVSPNPICSSFMLQADFKIASLLKPSIMRQLATLRR